MHGSLWRKPQTQRRTNKQEGDVWIVARAEQLGRLFSDSLSHVSLPLPMVPPCNIHLSRTKWSQI